MGTAVFPVSLALILLLFPVIGDGVKVSPRLDFGDLSPGIIPEHVKTYVEKEETSINPGVVKATLEVKVGESVVTNNHPTRTDKKGDSVPKKTKIVVCDVYGKCKPHLVTLEEDDEDDQNEGKSLKPLIVTDFDQDPLQDKTDYDNDDKTTGKKIPKIPVFVGYKGAVKDDDFPYTGHRYGPGMDRLPVYYGMKLSPAFHQSYPGPVIYEEVTHPSPKPDYTYGSYPTYPYYHEFHYTYSPYEERHPVSDISDYIGSKPYGHTSFSGYPVYPRTPSPYGRLHPTKKPDSFHAIITPLGRKSGGSVWPFTGTEKPAVYWPVHRPRDEYPSPDIIAVHGKMEFDGDEEGGELPGPSDPLPGTGTVKIDGKLGEALEGAADT